MEKITITRERAGLYRGTLPDGREVRIQRIRIPAGWLLVIGDELIGDYALPTLRAAKRRVTIEYYKGSK